MSDLRDGLAVAVEVIASYREAIRESSVGASATRAELVAGLAQSLPAEGAPLNKVVKELVEIARPGLMASAGPRYFGFVTGARRTLPWLQM